TLRRRGIRFVVLARFAIFPTGLLAATAGASGMEPRRFFAADAGALTLATGLVITAGYALGVAEDRAGVWGVAVGLGGLLTLATVFTIYLTDTRPAAKSR